MCGLVGVAATEWIGDRASLSVARDTLAHRGPDDAGEWWSNDGRVGLGHRRLSIVDLSPLGHQPMLDAARGLTVAFNGEIYNYRQLRAELASKGYQFRSNSDTEVLLAAYAEWKQEFLTRLNGMFALALYDANQGCVLLARDRAGEKPLFYKRDGNSLYFGSELKSLLANASTPRRIDPESFDCYLAMGFVPGERCILEGFNKLPPAHSLTFDTRTGALSVRRYWWIPDQEDAAKEVREDELLVELEHLLEDAVGRQLIADVPVGILLSGGVDSSLVTAMAVRQSTRVRTFSIGFPGHGKLDETPHARLIARHFGTEHTELMAEPATADLMGLLARQFDEPLVDSSMLPTYLVSKLVREHCTVALGGDGGDELFGGYFEYSRLLWMQRWSARLSRLPGCMAAVVGGCLPAGFARSNLRTWLLAAGENLNIALPLIATYFDIDDRCALLNGNTGSVRCAESIRNAGLPSNQDLVQRATRMDFASYLPEDILVKVDRASMLNSLEVRAPMLDHRVIEFAFRRVPSRLKATHADKKILLKRLASRVLPPEFDRQRKQGFSIPLAEWLRSGPFRELFWDTLTSSNCIFDRRTVRRLLEGQDCSLDNAERLFGLVHFELWRTQYGIAL